MVFVRRKSFVESFRNQYRNADLWSIKIHWESCLYMKWKKVKIGIYEPNFLDHGFFDSKEQLQQDFQVRVNITSQSKSDER